MEDITHNRILAMLEPERRKQLALARSILRDAQLAEDVHQDMLMKVCQNVATFDGPRHLRDWSWKVLRNRCYEVIRQSKYRPVLLDPSVLELVDDELESRDSEEVERRAAALKSCLEGLTANASGERCKTAGHQKSGMVSLSARMRGMRKAWVLPRTPVRTGGAEGLARAAQPLEGAVQEGRREFVVIRNCLL